jgi:hypothetical protein
VISTCFLPIGVARAPDDFVGHVGAESLAEQVGLAGRWVFGLGHVNHDAAPPLLAKAAAMGQLMRRCLDHEGAKVTKDTKHEEHEGVRCRANVLRVFALRALRGPSCFRDPNIFET